MGQNGHHKSHRHHSKHSHEKEKNSVRKHSSDKQQHKSSKDKKANEVKKTNSENQAAKENTESYKNTAAEDTPTKDKIFKESDKRAKLDHNSKPGDSVKNSNKSEKTNKNVSHKSLSNGDSSKNVVRAEEQKKQDVVKTEQTETKSVKECKASGERKEDKSQSSSKSSEQSSHRSKHHKHHHRDRSGSKSSSSEHRSHKHEHQSKSEKSHHHEGKSSESTQSQRSDSMVKSEQVQKTSEERIGEATAKKDFKEPKLDTGQTHTPIKSEHKSHSSDSHLKSSKGDSSSMSSDKSRSHHRKKRIVNCGVQVNMRRKTDTKATQVSDDIELGEAQDLSALKISEKKQQRIAYVQQSISNTSKIMKQPKGTPKKQQNVESSSSETAVCQFSNDFSSESQDNRLWKTETASIDKYKYKLLMHVEQYCNGGGLVLHAYQSELNKLSKTEQEEFALEFMDFCYGEPTEGVSSCLMGIVHEAINHWPDLIEHFADTYPNLTVKAGVLAKSDIETMSMEKYREQVHKTYQAGTFRCGPLLQVSMVGTAQEEVGDYFPEVLDLFESDPFLNLVMPWGELSSVRMASRNKSNDGPILWTRPGEQLIPTADMPKSPFKRKR